MMTVTVLYKGGPDDVFENVVSVQYLSGKAIQIMFLEDVNVITKVIHLDTDTSIMIDAK